MNNIIECKSLGKNYGEIKAVIDVSLIVESGEFAVLIGQSGSGKTTLLNMLGGLEKPSSGKTFIEGVDLTSLDENQLAIIRRKKVGFVFQSFNLISTLTAMENVEFPLYPTKLSNSDIRIQALNLLEDVGLKGRANHLPSELSGGERQRVAIARALIGDTKIVFADEPTGNLDSKTGENILKLMKRINKDDGVSFLVVTHDHKLAEKADSVVEIIDGRLK